MTILKCHFVCWCCNSPFPEDLDIEITIILSRMNTQCNFCFYGWPGIFLCWANSSRWRRGCVPPGFSVEIIQCLVVDLRLTIWSGTKLDRLWATALKFSSIKGSQETAPDEIDPILKKKLWKYLVRHREIIVKVDGQLYHSAAMIAKQSQKMVFFPNTRSYWATGIETQSRFTSRFGSVGYWLWRGDLFAYSRREALADSDRLSQEW